MATIPDDSYTGYSPIASPAWHRGPWGTKWWQALGLVKDILVKVGTLAVRERWLSVCSEEALARHGDALGWPRAPGETVGEYRTRLRQSWKLALSRGTKQGIVDGLTSMGLSNVEVLEAFTPGWGRHAGDPTKARWVNVVIRHPHPWGASYSATYGDGTTFGDGTLYGISADPRLLHLVRMIVARQASAYAHVEWIAVVLDGDIKHTGGPTDGDADTGAKVVYLPALIP